MIRVTIQRKYWETLGRAITWLNVWYKSHAPSVIGGGNEL
jgi:hypothetical protein